MPNKDDLPAGAVSSRDMEMRYAQLLAALSPRTSESRNLLKVLSKVTTVENSLQLLGAHVDNLITGVDAAARQQNRSLSQIYSLLDSEVPVLINGSSDAWAMWKKVGAQELELRKALVLGSDKESREESALWRAIGCLEKIVEDLSKNDNRKAPPAKPTKAPVYNVSFASAGTQRQHAAEAFKAADEMVACDTSKMDTKMLKLWLRILDTIATREQLEAVIKQGAADARVLVEIKRLLANQQQQSGLGGGFGLLATAAELFSGGAKAAAPTTVAAGTAGGAASTSAKTTPGFFAAAKDKVANLAAKTGLFNSASPGGAAAAAEAGAASSAAPGAVSKLGKVAQFASGWKLPAALASLGAGFELYDTWNDKTRTDEEKTKGSGVIAAKTGGALAGAMAGGAAGAAIGSVVPVVGTAIGGIVGSIGGGILGADGMEALSQKLLGLNSDNRIDNSSKIPKANPDKPQTIEQTLATIGSLQGSNHAIRRDSALAMVDETSKTKAVDIEKVKALHALNASSSTKTYDQEMRAAFDEIYKNQDVSPEAKKVLDTGMYSVRNAPKADKTVITPNVVTEREPSKTATAMLAALTGSATAQAANVPGSITNNTERTSEVARNVPTNTNTSTSQVTNNVTKPVVSAVTNTSPVTFKPLEPKDVAAIAAPLEAMRDDNAKKSDKYHKDQLNETKKANEEERSFWENLTKPISDFASSISTGAQNLYAKAKGVASDAAGAVVAGARSAKESWDSTAGSGKSTYERAKEAVSSGASSAGYTFNSASPNKGMTSFTDAHESKGNYSAFNPNDVGNVAYGKIQFNSGKSDSFKKVIQGYLDTGDKSSAAYQTIAKNKDAILSNNLSVLRSPEVSGALKSAGKEKEMQAVQDRVASEQYATPALKDMQKHGAKSLAAAQAMYDQRVNGGADSILRDTRAALGGKIGDTVNGQKIDEKTFLSTMVQKRADYLNNLAKKADAAGNTKKGDVYRSMVKTRIPELQREVSKNSDILYDQTTGKASVPAVDTKGTASTTAALNTSGQNVDVSTGHRYQGDTQQPVSADMRTQAGASLYNSAQDAIRQQANAALFAQAQQNQGKVGYKMGNKSLSSGLIDCSGWVATTNRSMMQQVNAAAGTEVFSKKDMAAVNDSSEGIIANVGKKTGQILNKEQLTQTGLKEGMMIGMDTGPREHDRGRAMGIDHIVQTVRDPKTGQLMISQSSSSGKGVSLTPADAWLAQQNKSKNKLFGVDPFTMVDKTDPAVQEKVAKNLPTAKATAPGTTPAGAKATATTPASATTSGAAAPATEATSTEGGKGTDTVAKTTPATAEKKPAGANAASTAQVATATGTAATAQPQTTAQQTTVPQQRPATGVAQVPATKPQGTVAQGGTVPQAGRTPDAATSKSAANLDKTAVAQSTQPASKAAKEQQALAEVSRQTGQVPVANATQSPEDDDYVEPSLRETTRTAVASLGAEVQAASQRALSVPVGGVTPGVTPGFVPPQARQAPTPSVSVSASQSVPTVSRQPSAQTSAMMDSLYAELGAIPGVTVAPAQGGAAMPSSPATVQPTQQSALGSLSQVFGKFGVPSIVKDKLAAKLPALLNDKLGDKLGGKASSLILGGLDKLGKPSGTVSGVTPGVTPGINPNTEGARAAAGAGVDAYSNYGVPAPGSVPTNSGTAQTPQTATSSSVLGSLGVGGFAGGQLNTATGKMSSGLNTALPLPINVDKLGLKLPTAVSDIVSRMNTLNLPGDAQGVISQLGASIPSSITGALSQVTNTASSVMGFPDLTRQSTPVTTPAFVPQATLPVNAELAPPQQATAADVQTLSEAMNQQQPPTNTTVNQGSTIPGGTNKGSQDVDEICLVMLDKALEIALL